MHEQITDIARNFFTLMGIDIEDIFVECQDEKKSIYLIQVKTSDSKILIGIHGQTLEMTRHLLVRILEKTLDTSLLIHLEVNDYLQAKDKKLYRYLESRIAHVMLSGEEIVLPDLTAYDRKKVHDYISNKKIDGLNAFSLGEGSTRKLYLAYNGAKTVSNLSIPTLLSPSRISLPMIDDNGIGI